MSSSPTYKEKAGSEGMEAAISILGSTAALEKIYRFVRQAFQGPASVLLVEMTGPDAPLAMTTFVIEDNKFAWNLDAELTTVQCETLALAILAMAEDREGNKAKSE